MRALLYPIARAQPDLRHFLRPIRHAWGGAVYFALCLAMGLMGAGCKKDKTIVGNPEESGKLSRMAEGLEKAFVDKPLPELSEAPALSDRINVWQDFRDCLVRTYVVRKRRQDNALRHGKSRDTGHASIGAEAVEECAVQAAVVDHDPTFCERLQSDFPGPNGEMTLPTLRCWDTVARIFAQPEKCPLIWMPGDGFGRNPECLAVAKRDTSLCPFAENPARCRALVLDSDGPCQEAGASTDCHLAVMYWGGLAQREDSQGEAELFDETALVGETGTQLQVRFLSDQDTSRRLNLSAPLSALGLSFAQGHDGQQPTPAWDPRWQSRLSGKANHITVLGQDFDLKIVFHGTGNAGQLPLSPPSPEAPATVIVNLHGAQGKPALHCRPGPETKGVLSYHASHVAPGAFVDGKIESDHLVCQDGSTARLVGKFRAAVLDMR